MSPGGCTKGKVFYITVGPTVNHHHHLPCNSRHLKRDLIQVEKKGRLGEGKQLFPLFQFCNRNGLTCFCRFAWLRHVRHHVSTSLLASTQNRLLGAAASWSYGLLRFMEHSVISLSLWADHTDPTRVSVSSLKRCMGKPEAASVHSRRDSEQLTHIYSCRLRESGEREHEFICRLMSKREDNLWFQKKVESQKWCAPDKWQ